YLLFLASKPKSGRNSTYPRCADFPSQLCTRYKGYGDLDNPGLIASAQRAYQWARAYFKMDYFNGARSDKLKRMPLSEQGCSRRRGDLLDEI
ncbi:hypothetical protein, partial [Rhizobium leguminosarum]